MSCVHLHVPSLKNEKYTFIEMMFRATRFRTQKICAEVVYYFVSYVNCIHLVTADCGGKVNRTRPLVMRVS